MRCPSCQHEFSAYQAIFLTRWKPLWCPQCGKKWTRRLDLQFFAVSALLAVGVLILQSFFASFIENAVLFIVWCSVVALIDSRTIRLKRYGGIPQTP
jgi:prepilin signal peptidase PulO-like enzyme (type II secretory pathway)